MLYCEKYTLTNQATLSAISLVEPLAQGELQQEIAAKETKPKPPPVPFRIDTTGLSTSHLPPPPKRQGGGSDATPTPVALKPKPSVPPPRLPLRQGPNPVPSLPQKTIVAEPDAHKGILNQGPLNRLGAAGVSVPGLGIGFPSSASPTQKHSTPSRNAAQLDELQSQFSRLSSHSPGPGIPSEGSTHVHKQTAPTLPPPYRKDLSLLLPSDAKSEQPSGLGKKKPPPLPVKKASLLSSGSSNEPASLLIPLSSKPKPQVSSLSYSIAVEGFYLVI